MIFHGPAGDLARSSLLATFPMAQFKPAGIIDVDSYALNWRILRHAHATTTSQNSAGMSVSVYLVEGKTKELIIDFPVIDHNYVRPKNTTNFEKQLLVCIKQALEEGWDPEKRGKPYKINAESGPCA